MHTNGVMVCNATGVDDIHSFHGEGVIIFVQFAQKLGGGGVIFCAICLDILNIV